MNKIFVTFEGIEGCGKSTQLLLLNDWLCRQGRDVIVTREPGGTRLGEKIRELLRSGSKSDVFSHRTEILLFEASRAQHVEEKILPALEAGRIVLCDRFCDSTTVYQGAARRLDGEVVEFFNSFATHGLMPSLTVLLDITVEESLRRIAARHANLDRIEQEGATFFQTVRDGYLALSKTDDRFFVIDGSGDVETIHKKMTHEFAKRFFQN